MNIHYVLQLRLVDSVGYSYTQKPTTRKAATYWRCSVRNKSTYGKATVVQRGDN